MTSGVRYAVVVWYETIMRALFALPRFRLLNGMKSIFLRAAGARVGGRVVYYPGVWISAPVRGLEIGDDVDLAYGVLITTPGGVSIGARTLVGYRTQILSANHVIPPAPGRIFGAGHATAQVRIGADVWIGANCLILPGVSIGEGAVVAGGSIVTKDIPAYAIAAGIPARVIRDRAGSSADR